MILFSFFRIPKLSVEGSIPFARSNVFNHLGRISLARCSDRLWRRSSLAAMALHLVSELAGSKWLEVYEWPLALAVCAIEYVRRTYTAEHASPKS